LGSSQQCLNIKSSWTSSWVDFWSVLRSPGETKMCFSYRRGYDFCILAYLHISSLLRTRKDSTTHFMQKYVAHCVPTWLQLGPKLEPCWSQEASQKAPKSISEYSKKCLNIKSSCIPSWIDFLAHFRISVGNKNEVFVQEWYNFCILAYSPVENPLRPISAQFRRSSWALKSDTPRSILN